MKQCWERLLAIFKIAPSDIVEVITGITSIAWGVWIILHPGLQGRQLFEYLARVPWWVYGSAMIVLGVMQFAGAACGYNRTARRDLAFWFLLLWGLLGWMRHMADPEIPSVVFYAAQVGSNGWIHLRCRYIVPFIDEEPDVSLENGSDVRGGGAG